MSFLLRSSPLAGGKTILAAVKCISLSKFYYDALLHVPTPSGILRLVRFIRCDSRLDPYDCDWLCDYAADYFFELTGYHMEDYL